MSKRRMKLTGEADRFDVLRDRLRIDLEMLDEEISQQSELFFQAANQSMLARSDRDATKESLRAVETELDAEARSELDKITEKAVTSWINAQPSWIKARREYLAACAEADRWDVLERSFTDRSHQLTALSRWKSAQMAAEGAKFVR